MRYSIAHAIQARTVSHQGRGETLGGSLSDQYADFGATLRAHREGRGITLDALAASMKVQRSLLVDLERNDVSRWPQGIYRRAFMRQYAMLVGLPPEFVLQQCGLFPEVREPARLTAAATGSSSELRLTMDDMPSRGRSATFSRVVNVAGILGLVLATSGLLALMTGLSFLAVCGVVALIWYPLASALYGNGASLRRLLRIELRRAAPSHAADDLPLVLHIDRSEQQITDQTFEGHRAEGDEDHGLPFSTSGQVH